MFRRFANLASGARLIAERPSRPRAAQRKPVVKRRALNPQSATYLRQRLFRCLVVIVDHDAKSRINVRRMILFADPSSLPNGFLCWDGHPWCVRVQRAAPDHVRQAGFEPAEYGCLAIVEYRVELRAHSAVWYSGGRHRHCRVQVYLIYDCHPFSRSLLKPPCAASVALACGFGVSNLLSASIAWAQAASFGAFVVVYLSLLVALGLKPEDRQLLARVSRYLQRRIRRSREA